jgi:hypothetical protein
MRIAYATYKLMAAAKGGERHVAFTRILHRAADDVLSQEVPTWRADPLHPECDDWCAVCWLSGAGRLVWFERARCFSYYYRRVRVWGVFRNSPSKPPPT